MNVKKILALSLLLASASAFAQSNTTARAVSATPTLTDNTYYPLFEDLSGNLRVVTTPASGSVQDVNIKSANGVTQLMGAGATGTGSERVTAAQDATTIAGSAPGTAGTPSANVMSVQNVANGTGADASGRNIAVGAAADGAAAAGNPNLLAGKNASGNVSTLFTAGGVLSIGGAVTPADGLAATTLRLEATNQATYPLETFNRLWNGTQMDMGRSIVGGGSTGAGVTAVTNNPTSNANNGIAPTNSTALESNHVIKNGAGNLFWLTVTSDANAGFLMIFNATSAPTDGAVTPVYCVPIAASSGNPFSWQQVPMVFSTGITAVYSSTGCLTKTASVHATFYWGAL